MNKYDELLKKAELFERLAKYGNRESFLRALAEGWDASTEHTWLGQDELGRPKTEGIPAPPPAEPAKPVTTIPTVTIHGFPSIPIPQQEALSRIVTIEGIGMPLSPDGQLGPKTQAAINAFKKRFNVPQLNNKQVLQLAKLKVDKLPKYQ